MQRRPLLPKRAASHADRANGHAPSGADAPGSSLTSQFSAPGGPALTDNQPGSGSRKNRVTFPNESPFMASSFQNSPQKQQQQPQQQGGTQGQLHSHVPHLASHNGHPPVQQQASQNHVQQPQQGNLDRESHTQHQQPATQRASSAPAPPAAPSAAKTLQDASGVPTRARSNKSGVPKNASLKTKAARTLLPGEPATAPSEPAEQAHGSVVSAMLSSPYSEEVISRSSSTSGRVRSDSFLLLSRGTSLSSSRSAHSSVTSRGKGGIPNITRSVSWRFLTAKRDSMGKVVRPNDEWQSILSRAEYKILREKCMEPPYTGKYVNFSMPPGGEIGLFLCRGCGESVFLPQNIKMSTTGWVTFSSARANAVRIAQGVRNGMNVNEVYCASCHGFLGMSDRGYLLINSHAIEFVIPNLPAHERSAAARSALNHSQGHGHGHGHGHAHASANGGSGSGSGNGPSGAGGSGSQKRTSKSMSTVKNAQPSVVIFATGGGGGGCGGGGGGGGCGGM
ncbi:Peptide methionine sulfoxide reductase MsrB [Porphyridium purpureum]|uniref:peptide-methionine (R)-S-oxide reductase n=1 Tax=Porphyridium purpureum TaxID=35688 RepID=A0A5J4YKE2_PORPP|nr:Peptide methionine sulfoxide reductase MsrB [Porphyridium purpureum]|eukprot:POR1994..scf291_13